MAAIPDRRCRAGCKRLLFTRQEVSEGNIRLDPERHAVAHCPSSRTCDWCTNCHSRKLAECGVKAAQPPEPRP